MKIVNGDKLIKFINGKWQGRACPMCGIGKWVVTDKIFELREYNDGNLVVGKNCSVVPVVPIICENCGNTIFVNAMIAEAVEEK